MPVLQAPTAELTEAIWRDYHARLRAFVARRVSDSSDVDDIVQEVFVKIHTRIGSLRESEKLQSWVYQIARNAITDQYRRHDPSRLPEVIETLPVIDRSEAIERELVECLRPLIDRLPDDYREALLFTDLEGRTQSELAEQHGLSLPGAKSRVQRGRAQLKALFERCCQFEFSVTGRVIGYQPKECTRSTCCS